MKRLIMLGAALALLLVGCQGLQSLWSGIPGQSLQPAEESAGLPEEPLEEPIEEESPGAEPSGPFTMTLTVPEGYTLPRIGMTLEEMGVCTTAEFIAAAQEGDFFDFPLIAAQEEKAERCYTLEGYLFPDTYEIYASDPPEAVIRRMLAHMEQTVNEELRSRIAGSGYTVDEIITMASIIEKEAYGKEQMPLISSVLHNRLDIGMRLQCDVTINYVEGAIKHFVEGDYAEAYNTYKCDGLPAGAICNPGIAAIEAALAPAETEYFFFVTDRDKNYYYAETWEEHLDNVAVAMPAGAEEGEKEES